MNGHRSVYVYSSNILCYRGSVVILLMLDPRALHRPTIIYRPIQPSDLEALEQIHAALFPIRYEREFFFDVVNGHGIVSWAAVDINRPDGQNGELVGFVTVRMIPAKESEIEDLLRYDASRRDQTLAYILTLGVVEGYRKLGIGTSLVREVIKYASSVPNCRAVYLHVLACNQPAINLYKKMLFKLVRRLPNYYYFQGQHYDSYLFVHYLNSGRSHWSPLEIMAVVAAYFWGLFRMLSAKLRNDEKNLPRWSKCKETSTLYVTQNKKILLAENATCQGG